MATYTTVFRTSSWDEGIASIAARAHQCCRSGNFVVAADESKGDMNVEPYVKVSHKHDFSYLSLPEIPRDDVLGWNADFVLYHAVHSVPKTDYYVFIEEDAFLNCDMDGLVNACTQEEIDFAAHHLRRLPETHWLRHSIRDVAGQSWCAFMPIVILSCDAVDVLFRARQAMAVGVREGGVRNWPHWEAFVPTIIANEATLNVAEIARFVNAESLRSRPVLSLREVEALEPGSVAHPVISGAGFFRAFIESEPTGDISARRLIDALVASDLTDTKSHDRRNDGDLRRYQAGFIKAAFGDNLRGEFGTEEGLHHFRMDSVVKRGSGVDGLSILLQDKESQTLFVKSVKAIVHEKILAREFGFHNIDKLADLAAGVDSSQYAMMNMSEAKRFETGNDLRDFAIHSVKQTGMILEFGVYSGYTINRFASQCPDRRVFGFDSFDGLPETFTADFQKGSLRSVPPDVLPNVELVVGWFDKTLQPFADAHPREHVALMHIDCDVYSSTKAVFAAFGNRIVPGTVIVFDEYFNYPGWRRHEYRAFQEFVLENRVTYRYVGLVPNGAQVLVIISDVGG